MRNWPKFRRFFKFLCSQNSIWALYDETYVTYCLKLRLRITTLREFGRKIELLDWLMIIYYLCIWKRVFMKFLIFLLGEWQLFSRRLDSTINSYKVSQKLVFFCIPKHDEPFITLDWWMRESSNSTGLKFLKI